MASIQEHSERFIDVESANPNPSQRGRHALHVRRPHVLKHGLLSTAAMLGGGGRPCPGGTTTSGGSTGSAGGTGTVLARFVFVQLSVAAEQLPVSVTMTCHAHMRPCQHQIAVLSGVGSSTNP